MSGYFEVSNYTKDMSYMLTMTTMHKLIQKDCDLLILS